MWRMNTDFFGVDYAEEHLVIHGVIEDVSEVAPYVAVRVGFRIHNPDQGADTRGEMLSFCSIPRAGIWSRLTRRNFQTIGASTVQFAKPMKRFQPISVTWWDSRWM